MCEVTAYHEAGHAFVAVRAGAKVLSLTIAPDNDDGPERFGDTKIAWPVDKFSQRDLAAKAVLVALAGPVAEMIHRGEPYHPGLVPEWASDWQNAWHVSAALFPDKRRRLAHLERMTSELYQLLFLDEHWTTLAIIVDNLLAYERLEGSDLEEILQF
jgi:ATP-dependent Zn protease